VCGRVIQSSGPLRYAIVDGMNVRDSRVHNYPPKWNAAPSQELLVVRRNRKTGEVSLDPLRWGLIPHWCNDPSGGDLRNRLTQLGVQLYCRPVVAQGLDQITACEPPT
jgi:putative SOS response-associated peptidase YedK